MFTSTHATPTNCGLKLGEDPAAGWHGGMPQADATGCCRACASARSSRAGNHRCAARIDVPTISHVINYGLPTKAEDTDAPHRPHWPRQTRRARSPGRATRRGHDPPRRALHHPAHRGRVVPGLGARCRLPAPSEIRWGRATSRPSAMAAPASGMRRTTFHARPRHDGQAGPSMGTPGRPPRRARPATRRGRAAFNGERTPRDGRAPFPW